MKLASSDSPPSYGGLIGDSPPTTISFDIKKKLTQKVQMAEPQGTSVGAGGKGAKAYIIISDDEAVTQ